MRNIWCFWNENFICIELEIWYIKQDRQMLCMSDHFVFWWLCFLHSHVCSSRLSVSAVCVIYAKLRSVAPENCYDPLLWFFFFLILLRFFSIFSFIWRSLESFLHWDLESIVLLYLSFPELLDLNFCFHFSCR